MTRETAGVKPGTQIPGEMGELARMREQWLLKCRDRSWHRDRHRSNKMEPGVQKHTRQLWSMDFTRIAKSIQGERIVSSSTNGAGTAG